MRPSSQPGLHWLENRPLGDANGDGRFDSADLEHVLAAGKYEVDVPRNATFDEGDGNGHGDFTTADLVLAMQAGNYEAIAVIGTGRRPGPAASSTDSMR